MVGCKGVVIAADNKTTHYIDATTMWEEENNNHKIIEFPSDIFVMCAGVNYAKSIVLDADIREGDTIDVVCEKIKKSIFDFGNKLKFIMVLAPQGFVSWEDYKEQQNKLHLTTSATINTNLEKCVPDCVFIVVVYNSNKQEAAIRTIGANGYYDSANEYGFAAIGSGAALVNFSILKSKYNSKLPQKRVEEIVREAMEDASHGIGVGTLGQIIIRPETS